MHLAGECGGLHAFEAELTLQPGEERDPFAQHDRHDIQPEFVHEPKGEALPRDAAPQKAHPLLTGVVPRTPPGLFDIVHDESEPGPVLLDRLLLTVRHQVQRHLQKSARTGSRRPRCSESCSHPLPVFAALNDFLIAARDAGAADFDDSEAISAQFLGMIATMVFWLRSVHGRWALTDGEKEQVVEQAVLRMPDRRISLLGSTSRPVWYTSDDREY